MKKKLSFVILLLVLLSGALAYDDDDEYGDRKSSHKKWWSTPLIIVVYLGFFLLAAGVSLCIRHFRDRRSLLDLRNIQRREAERGLDAKEIESLPSLRYSEMKLKGLEKGEEQLECAVCLAEFKDQEVVRILPHCYHVFHPSCIAPWLASHVTCPICRSSLEHREGSNVSMSSVFNAISQRFDHSGSQHDDHNDGDDHHHHDRDHDDLDHVTVEIEGSSTLQSEENVDHGSVVTTTSATTKLPTRSYSTGDITVQMVENHTAISTQLSSLMPRESCPKSDYRTTTVDKSGHWGCIASKSDRFVDYSSLMFVQRKSTPPVVVSPSHEDTLSQEP